ncbi:hypothetical protein GCK32_006761 [Trichostrongylus colubriformis]|uniref:Exonuclease domain-containing protein n=1 Tax=Trichostrongylus colubriformis TaxID=6319 RepID=A0AAN8FKH1_TRICO
MAESDDGSFFEEPIFGRTDAVEEPETQALDFGDEVQEMEADDKEVQEVENDDRDSPFVAQMPVTPPPQSHRFEQQAPPTTPSKIAQFASKMGMIPPQVQQPMSSNLVRADMDDDLQPPTSSVIKRSSKITISPTKTIKRKRFGGGEAVNTFVFMDFETTGSIGEANDTQYRLLERKLHEPHDYSNALTKLITETQRSEYPRITEMSFISVPREVFVRGQARMKELSDLVPDESLQVRLAANVHSRQVNPQLDERRWNAYEDSRKAGKCCLNLAREDLILKCTFAEEWPAVRSFLELCPKPACLVAHNGLFFDYRVLYGELLRCGFIEKDMGIPEGVVFIDSYLAIRELEERHRVELQQATRLVDWKMRVEITIHGTLRSGRYRGSHAGMSCVWKGISGLC